MSKESTFFRLGTAKAQYRIKPQDVDYVYSNEDTLKVTIVMQGGLRIENNFDDHDLMEQFMMALDQKLGVVS